jgi:hypothetical protein
MVLFSKDGWVWLEHAKESWIPVKMVAAKDNKIMAKSSSGEVPTIPYHIHLSRALLLRSSSYSIPKIFCWQQFVLDTSATMATVNTSSLTHGMYLYIPMLFVYVL